MPEILARHRQFVLFLLVGGASALIDVGLLQLLLMNGAGVLASTSAGFGAGLLFNFVCHARYTFTTSISGSVFVRYLCVVALNYLITLACVGIAVTLALAPVTGKIVALLVVPVIGYMLGKYWIFK